jgi:hypothetical protein
MFFSGVLQYVWPNTPIRRSSRLTGATNAGDSTEVRTSSSSDQHTQELHEEAPPRPPDFVAAAPPQMPSTEVHLLLVDFPHAPSLPDLFDVGIGDADPAFANIDDLYIISGRSSSCDDLGEDYESDEHEFHDAATTLEDMLWLAELFHNPERMGRSVHHQRKRIHLRQSQGTCVEERGMNDTDLGDQTNDRGKTCMFEALNEWRDRPNELHAWGGGTGPIGLRTGASMLGPRLATPVPSFPGPGPGCADPMHAQAASVWPDLGHAFGDGWVEAGHGVGGIGEPGVADTAQARPRHNRAQPTRTARNPAENIAELNDNSFHELAEDDDDKDMDYDGGEVDFNSVRWRFRDTTWSQSHFTYAPPRRPFYGKRGPIRHYDSMPTFLHLFDLYWSYQTLRSIVKENNRYAVQEVDDHGKPRGGDSWVLLTIPGLKAFLAISMYMGMKKQPNLKTYWQKPGSIFHCPIISKSFTHERFMAIRNCLHITNPTTYANVERGEVGFDKLRQIRWLVDAIRNAC